MVACAVAAGRWAPFVLPPFYVRVGQLMLYSAGLGVAWTILGGFAGYASFGHAAFIGVGAFAAGLVEARFSGLPPPLLLLLGLAVGGALLRGAVGGDLLSDPAPARHLLRHRHAGRQPCLRRAQQQRRLLQGLARAQLPAVAPSSLEPATFFY